MSRNGTDGSKTEETVYRVRITRTHKWGHKGSEVLGPYQSLSAARGIASTAQNDLIHLQSVETVIEKGTVSWTETLDTVLLEG